MNNKQLIEEAREFINQLDDDGYYAELIERLSAALEKLMNENRWIPASEPPKQNGTYLCVVQYHYDGKQHPHITILDYATKLKDVDNFDFKGRKHGGFYDYGSEQGYFEWKNVSHWRPLPEPPKGE